MGSIDFSQYIDLTIDDKSPSEIYEEAVEYGRNALPELNPRAGTLEDALMQSFAYIGSATIGAINRLPDGLMEGVLKLHGLERLEATFATLNVEFTLSELGGSVPAGTAVIYNYNNGQDVEQCAFELAETLIAASNSYTVVGIVTSVKSGVIPNIPAGAVLAISEPSSIILLCESVEALTQGNTAETSEEYFARGTSYLQSLSRVLTTGRQVENFILTTFADVKRCKVYDLAKAVVFNAAQNATNLTKNGATATVETNSAFATASAGDPVYRVLSPEFYGNTQYSFFKSGTFIGTFSGNNLEISNPVGGTGSSGPVNVVNLTELDLLTIESNPDPGFFAIFVCGQNGTPISQSLKTKIRESIEERIVAGLSFEILDIWTYDLKFSISIAVDPSYIADDVVDEVKAAIETGISPDEWKNWDSVVRIFDIVVEASRIAGVSYVFAVSATELTYPATAPGNNLLYAESTNGSQLIGYAPSYAGLLPRATVQVSVA
jgi:hypothetical protein